MNHIRRYLYLIVAFAALMTALHGEDGSRNKKGYLRLENNSIRFIYNRMNLPMLGLRFNYGFYESLSYDLYKFYYYKDGNYQGRRTADFNTVLYLKEPWSEYEDRPFDLSEEREFYWSGYIYKFSGERLVMMGEVNVNSADLPFEELDPGSLPVKDRVIFNEEGYPSKFGFALGYQIGLYGMLYSKGDYDYDYYEEGLTYDGRKRIKRMYRREKGKLRESFDFQYDKRGRIVKISLIDYPSGKDAELLTELHFFYKRRGYHVLRLGYKYNDITIFDRLYNSSGYLESEDRNDLDETLDYNIDPGPLLERVKGLALPPSRGLRKERYRPANPEYSANLKLQPILSGDIWLSPYFLGITGWYRYAYLNDIDPGGD